MKLLINRELSVFLDFARWASAFLVLLTHVTNRMMAKYSTLKDPGLVDKAWGFAAGFAHHAVVVFFVLSGFLVGGRLLSRPEQFDLGKYTSDRLSRIHTVLVPVILVTITLDGVGLSVWQDPYYSSDLWRHLDWPTILGNVLLLQNFAVPTIGTNGPLGTLANEVWYYVTFPLLIAPLLMPGRGLWQAAVGAAVLSVMAYIQPEHGVGFVLWLTGAAAGWLNPLKIRAILPALGFVALVIALRLIIRDNEHTFNVRTITDLLVAISFAAILSSMRTKPFTMPLSFLHPALAKFSYSLYAVHAPVITLFAASAYSLTGFGFHTQPSSPVDWALVIGVLAIAVFAAFLLSLATEKSTPLVRDYLRGKLSMRSNSRVDHPLA